MSKVNKEVIAYLYSEKKYNPKMIGLFMGIHYKTVKKYLFEMNLLKKKKKPNEIRDEYGRYIYKGQILAPFEYIYHPNYTTGKASYRNIGKRIHGEHCHYCGKDENIQIHHIDKNRSNNHPSNLIPVCSKCHYKLHEKDKKRDKNGRFIPSKKG